MLLLSSGRVRKENDMALSPQFKRCVVAVFNEGKYVVADNELERAVASVEICRANLVRYKYLTRPSLGRDVERMRQTSKGVKASRIKRLDSTHFRKMRQFKDIWALYLEAYALGMTEG